METKRQNSANQTGNMKKYVLTTFLLVLVLAAVGLGVWYWQQQTINEQNARVKDLENKVETLNSEKEKPTNTSEDQEEKQTEYQAEVGKFTLTLPNKYKVIQQNDGGGEGGPSTHVLIAEETDTPGVFESSIWDKITISGIPMQATNTSFESRVKNKLSNSHVIEEKKTTIDGVQADVYLVGGLGTMKKIYFANNDIFYEIDMRANTDTANKRLDVIKNGFQFSQ